MDRCMIGKKNPGRYKEVAVSGGSTVVMILGNLTKMVCCSKLITIPLKYT